MAKYESLPTTHVSPEETILPSHDLPELVRLDDDASTVMIDYTHTPAHIIAPDKSMDDALNEMKATGAHLLLAQDNDGHLHGIISSEAILGEKPIKIIQEKRIARENITVAMLMTPVETIIALDTDTLKDAKVGHIVKTIKDNKRHYALVLDKQAKTERILIRGLFTLSQIGKQLHTDLS